MNKRGLLPGISGSTLKCIAMVSMVLDHIGAAFLGRGYFGVFALEGPILTLYWVLRWAGRIAFPIYCFLLVEGMTHTRSKRNYILRLFAFALISEVPFDMCFFGGPLYWDYQNVFWTLGLGALAVWAIGQIREKRQLRYYYLVVVCVVVAWLTKADYGAFGVFYICLLSILNTKKNWVRNLWGSVAIAWEYTAILAFLPIQMYNGKRGVSLKYVFYFFYPAHLFLIGLLTYGVFGV